MMQGMAWPETGNRNDVFFKHFEDGSYNTGCQMGDVTV